MMKNLASIEENMSNLTSASGEAALSASSYNGGIYPPPPQPQPIKKKRNQPGHPDPEAEVIGLSPRTLMATNRFVCDVCKKGFQRDQNLQLHRRGHNLPWKLKQRTSKEIRKKVYICPEISCVHHDPSRALGDLTGIKKHFCRKHGEKKWKCEKCSKKYAVQSDWKAHAKTCGTREYRCDCGTLFSRRDSFITHRAFCDALAEESAKSITPNTTTNNIPSSAPGPGPSGPSSSSSISHHINLQTLQSQPFNFHIKKEHQNYHHIIPPWLSPPPQIFQTNPNPNGPTTPLPPHPYPPPPYPHISATALLQKAASMGAKTSSPSPAGVFIKPHQGHVPAAPARDLSNSLSSYGHHKAASAAVTGGGSTEFSGAPACDTSITNNPSSLLHEMMMMNNPQSNHGFEATSFEDMAFGGMLSSHALKKDDEEVGTFHATLGQFSSNGGGDGMTRDFLGLRALSQSDILSIASLSNCMSGNGNNACNEHQNF